MLNNIYDQLTLRLYSILWVGLIWSVKVLKGEKKTQGLPEKNSDSRLYQKNPAWVSSLLTCPTELQISY